MVATYIFNCMLIRTKPCKYFQLNSIVFNAKDGIFSKLDIDQLIPEKWRLVQMPLAETDCPASFPVFVKPEWGQNSSGIIKADNLVAFESIKRELKDSNIKYLVQQAAAGKYEFEIFSIQHSQDKEAYAEFTVTLVENDSETYPVNSIYNSNTRYKEITDQFDEKDKSRIWQLMGEIGRFGISRVGLRANSIEEFLAGNFQVIEINLFVPMPINMLDPKYKFWDLWGFVRHYMMSLARITKARDKSLPEKPVFTKMMLYNRSNPVLNYLKGLI